MNEVRIGFLRGFGYILSGLLVALVFGTIIFISIIIRRNIQNHQNEKLLYNNYIEVQNIKN